MFPKETSNGLTSVPARPRDLVDELMVRPRRLATRVPLAKQRQRTDSAALLPDILIQHAGGSGIASLWEQQLLKTPVETVAG